MGSLYFFYQRQSVNYVISLPEYTGSILDHKVVFDYGEHPTLSSHEYFSKVKQQFIADMVSFIEANLSEMTLSVYQEGKLSFTVPIVTKGRPGSWWETPAGLYTIKSKARTHLSSIGQVYMPWSLNFQGNFFIHGRTYYPDGTLSPSQYTGGCIRLSTEDAEKVYKTVQVGTPILVHEKSLFADDFSYTKDINIDAPIYLAADLKNNHVFGMKESKKEIQIASITKLMTALIATEYINLDNIATVSKESLIYTSKPRLQVGQRYSVYQLLFPLLMESSNEAAEVIARYYGRENFIKKMNDKAVSIGMINTKFADSSGASAENISTAEDLFMLAKYIYNNRSFIFKLTSGSITNSAYGSSGFANLSNFNDFVGRDFFFGGKNGKANVARESSLSVFELPVNNDKRPIVFIVLYSQNASSDSENLINQIMSNLPISFISKSTE